MFVSEMKPSIKTICELVHKPESLLRTELVKFLHYGIIFDQQLAVFFLWPGAIERPTWCYGVNMESAENGLLDMVWNGHVIFNRVESS